MKIGLALSGGGARGFSHLGAAKALIENGIPIDVVAGTSAGSIVGSMIASGAGIEEMMRKARGIGWLNVMRPSMSPTGSLSNAPLGAYITKGLRKDDFDALEKPLSIVAWDIENSERVVMSDGRLSSAIRASCAVPGIFSAVSSRGRLMIDGGICEIIPVRAAREMGADVVIAVDLVSSGIPKARPRTAFGVTVRAALSLLKEAAGESGRASDILVIPQIGHIRPDQMNKREELIELGERAVLELLPAIREKIG